MRNDSVFIRNRFTFLQEDPGRFCFRKVTVDAAAPDSAAKKSARNQPPNAPFAVFLLSVIGVDWG
ncbi:MAG: hypothetical protein K9N10_23160 [Deltaproteobacteria bacterium]|nr:hypothetical protein [Deltaproteobacteria bacterium]